MTSSEQADDPLANHLIRAASLFTRAAGRIAGEGYSSIAWRVLADLERDGAARISELATQQRVAQPSMTALVQRLENEACVERRSDPADGRAVLIGITPTGIRALAGFRTGAAEGFAPLLAQLSAAELNTLRQAAELLERLSRSAK